ncbi:MAG: tripartite tricarboxylate transporter permease, partial [Alphaproteobacteria bacterium]
WSVALANILGAGLSFMFSDQFAKVAIISYADIMPLILTVVFVGAFQGSRQWGDIYALVLFGVLGWIMKRLGWPRPPLILGFVLGDIVERYLFISVQRYGADWLLRPVVIVMFALALYGIARPFIREISREGGLVGMFSKFSRPGFDIQTVFYVGFIALIGAMIFAATSWDMNAKIVPLIVGSFTVVVATTSLLNYTFRRSSAGADEGMAADVKKSLHLDLKSEDQHLGTRVIMTRAVTYLAWLLGFIGLAALIGMLATVFLFVVLYMRIEGKERWTLVLPIAFGILIFSAVLFDELLALPWPQTVFGDFYLIFKEAAVDPFKRMVWETLIGPIAKLF